MILPGFAGSGLLLYLQARPGSQHSVGGDLSPERASHFTAGQARRRRAAAEVGQQVW